MRSTLNLLLFLSLAAPAFASDGVLEINQTCAIQTGCFAGDSAGYPVTISLPGSYRLTSNLRRSVFLGGSQNEHFIEISADDVSVDLGGFLISCATSLGGSCSGTGSGVVVVNPTTISSTSVKNGSITGMAFRGIDLGHQSEVTNVRVRNNGEDGIHVDHGSSIISGNTAYSNGSVGILGGNDSTISGNTSNFNEGAGILGGSGSTISGNTSNFNGGNGIGVNSSATVQGNTARNNAGFGISLLATSAYRDNTINTSTESAGTVIGGVNAGGNVCNGSLTCP